MSAEWIVGFAMGLLAVAVVCYVVRKIVVNRGRRPGAFDERQLAVRGRAFAIAYAIIMIYLAIWLFMNMLEVPFFENSHSVLLGMLLSIAVFVGYSVFKDAYFRTSDRPGAWIAMLAVVSAINVGMGIGRMARGGTIEARLYENANLMAGAMTTAMLACVLIKWAMDRRGEGE